MFSGNNKKPSEIARSMSLITIGGSLCMVYVVGTASPIATDFFKMLGADDFHFGLLGGLPIFMLGMQFLGAYLSNIVQRRKPLFLWMVILGRLVYIPIAFFPLLFPDVSPGIVLAVAIPLVALSSGMGNMTGPLWFSWMADLIPERILNRYWGARQTWVFFSWASSFVAVMIFSYFCPLPARIAFPIVAGIGVFAGVIDILLFIWVPEPPNTVVKDISVTDALLEPIRHHSYRRFILFSCAWNASAMCAAAFMQIYVLRTLEVPVWQTTLMWCIPGMAIAFASKWWGRLTDRHGSRPAIIICVALKPMIVVVFMLLSKENVRWLLPMAFAIDGCLNAGMMVAMNGYMLKISPKRNRSMFIASIMALSGICGGVAVLTAGAVLRNTTSVTVDVAGISWTNYQMLFAASFFFRFCCLVLALFLKEPKSSSHMHVLLEVIGNSPVRFLRLPIGLYRRIKVSINGNGDE